MHILADSMTDSYKAGNSKTYSCNVFGTQVEIANSYSNFTPRKNAYMKFCDQSDEHLVVYGTRHTFQSVIDMWDQTFFQVDLESIMEVFTRRLKNHFGNISDHATLIEDMKNLHNVGFLPIEVRSIDEGTKYPLGLPVFTVEATIDGYGWLVNYLETVCSNLIWPMMNTATKCEQFYLQASHYGHISAPTEAVEQWLPYCVHEFGLRGYWGPEAGVRTSSAHSLFFLGSDTIAVIDFFENYYDANSDKEAIAVSVRASEHADISRMLSLFRHLAQKAIDENTDNEHEVGDITIPFIEGPDGVYQFVPAVDVLNNTEKYVLAWFIENSTGIMSYVSDTEDYYRLINVHAKNLKERIELRKDREDGQPARLVFRPDSSRRTPLTVICGYRICEDVVVYRSHPDVLKEDECALIDGKYYLSDGAELFEISKEEAEGSLISLWNTFGGTEVSTEEGMMKLINPKVGLLYGEAISQSHQKEIYERMLEMGFSAVNILMGKGSYASLEGSTRDLFSMSYKQTFSEALIGDERVNLAQQKTPMGDVSKTSARGLLRVERVGTTFELFQDQTRAQQETGELTLLLRDGKMIKNQSLSGIKDTYRNS